MWIADVVRSAQEIQSEHLLGELNALCNALEAAESHQSRARGSP